MFLLYLVSIMLCICRKLSMHCKDVEFQLVFEANIWSEGEYDADWIKWRMTMDYLKQDRGRLCGMMWMEDVKKVMTCAKIMTSY